MLVPISYSLRSLFVRKAATALTVLGIGATVAIFAGVLALQQGFTTMFTAGGREDIAVFLRPGATGETDSQFRRDLGLKLIKGLREIEQGPSGPLASMECYFAVLRDKTDGGQVNVPLRGVQPATFEIRQHWTCEGQPAHGLVVRGSAGRCPSPGCGLELRPQSDVPILEGRRFQPGTDEVIVGRKLVDRIHDCHLGDVIQINTTPCRVVGIFDHDGAYASEIWGDLDRFLATMDRYGPNRVIAKVVEGTVIGGDDPAVEPEPGTLAAKVKSDPEVPAKVQSEKAFLLSQTRMLGGILMGLGFVLALIMGVGAVFTAVNTMLTAISARTHEIGILLALGYRPAPIFFAFLFESLVLCLLGGVAGCLMSLPFNGIETGTMNGQTFTEVAFAFRVTWLVLVSAMTFSVLLGLVGGVWPALRACMLSPTEALRRH